MGVQPNNGIRGLYRYDFDVIEILQKEIDQMQVVNNELTAELHRYKERERLEITGDDQLTRDRETAEDYLWNSQQNLKTEKAYAKGFATATVISAPAAAALLWGVTVSEHLALVWLLALLAVVFSIFAVGGAGVVIAKVFGMIPETKRLIASNQRALDRAVLKEMSL